MDKFLNNLMILNGQYKDGLLSPADLQNEIRKEWLLIKNILEKQQQIADLNGQKNEIMAQIRELEASQ